MKKIILSIIISLTSLVHAKIITVKASTICPTGSERLADGSCYYKAHIEPKCPGDSRYVGFRGGCVTEVEYSYDGKPYCPKTAKLEGTGKNTICLHETILSPVCPAGSEYVSYKKGCIKEPTCPSGFNIVGDCLKEKCECVKTLFIEESGSKEKTKPFGIDPLSETFKAGFREVVDKFVAKLKTEEKAQAAAAALALKQAKEKAEAEVEAQEKAERLARAKEKKPFFKPIN